MTADQVIAQLPYYTVAETFVEPPRLSVERGHAQEHIGGIPKNAFFCEADQPRSNSQVAELRGDTDSLNVADKSALHIENEKACKGLALVGEVALAGFVRQDGTRGFISASERNPRFGIGHDLSADMGFDGRL